MLKRLLILVLLMAVLALPTWAQTSFYTDRALQQVNVLTSPTPLTAAIPYGPVRVCSLPLTQQSPCLPLATITDINGNPISNSIGPLFGQLTTDATGRFTFGCTLGNNYQVQVTQAASNTPAVNYPITCPGVGSNPQFASLSATNLTVPGATTSTGTFTCKNFENQLCLDATNTAGWAGSDVGAQMNSMCSALPASGGIIYYNPNGVAQTLTTQVTDCGKSVTFLLDNPNITSSITAFWLQHNGSSIFQRSGATNGSLASAVGITASSSLPAGSPLILLQSSPANANMQENKLDGLRLTNGRHSRTALIQAIQTINLQVSNITADGVNASNFYTHAVQLDGSFSDYVTNVHCNNVGNALGCVVLRSLENGTTYNSSNNTIKDVTSVTGAMVQLNLIDPSGVAPTSLDTTNIITGTFTSNGAPPAALGVSTLSNSPASGSTSVNVQAGQGVNFHAGDPCLIGDTSKSEENKVTSISTDTLNLLFPTYIAHTSGERVVCSTFGIVAGGNTQTLKIDSPHMQDCADCVDLQSVQGFSLINITVGATNTPIGDGIRCDPCRDGVITSPVYGNIVNGLHVTSKSGAWLSQSRNIKVINPFCSACTNDVQDDVNDISPVEADGISEIGGNWPIRLFTVSVSNVRRDTSLGCSGAACQVNLYGPNTRLGTAGESLTFVGSSSGTCTQNASSNSGALVAGCNFVAAGAVCTNGELALSAGWQSTGSATVTAVAGQGQTCSWTITTGTTTAANPTVTDTVTNPLPSASVVCEMNIHGGTHTAAAGEGFQQTTLSATAPVFTFNGTPTAGGTTYFVTRRCGP